MKIGMVCYPTYGGSGVVATELGTELARRGHEVHFVSYEPPARYCACVEGLYYHEVEMTSYPLFRHPPYLLAMASKMAEIVETAGVELFHVHYAIPHTISACLARAVLGRKDIPIVTTLHGTDITIVGREPAYFRMVQFALRDTTRVTAVSRSLADDTVATFGFDGEIEVIPNFIDPSRFAAAADSARERRALADKPMTLVHVSNYRPVKRATDVVKVFAKVAASLPARLLLVGDGPELSACRKLANDLGVLDRVRFVGETPDVISVLAKADLFILPSEQESFGLSALEAMAAGLPVISTRVGGLPEVVDDGKTGFLFEVGDIDGMARKAVEVLSNPSMHAEVSRAASERAADEFSQSRIVSMYEDCYRRQLASATL